jgi:hypothetical protein
MCRDSAIAFGLGSFEDCVWDMFEDCDRVWGLWSYALAELNGVIALLGKLLGVRSRHHDNNLNPLSSANFRSNVTVLLQPSCCAIAPIK